MSTIVIEAKPCPNCGKLLPAGALGGLCPACLLAQGAETQGEGGERVRFVPPSLEELRKLFPQLEIESLLGAGGMGAVYKARQPALDRWVALKILPAEGGGGVNFEERFNREARALARLNHPNIVTVHEFGKTGALHYFLMEFVDGTNLREVERAGRLSPREALQIIPQICEALQYAHDEGVVHRDIKPENVLIDRKGRVKIADFGLAKILGQDPNAHRLTVEGQVMGTPHYMAPEQVEKPLAVDHRADIYALGVVFYEMLTGELPIGKFSPPSRKVELDVRLDDVVLRALENDPARRYQHASEVKTQIESIASTPSPEPSTAPVRKFVRWAGFRLVAVEEGTRTVQWREVAKAAAVFFGLLSIAFGFVTLATKTSLWGWVGVIGWPSVVARLLIVAGIVGFGVWRALRRKLPPPVAEKTAVMRQPGERFSRKAILGACLVPVFVLSMAMMFMTTTVAHVAPDAPPSGPKWWQVALMILVTLIGLSIPVLTTLLGWLAVADIRRTHGRVYGLPLALFDGLLFPLLLLNVPLYLGVNRGFYWFTATQLDPSFKNPPGELVVLGSLLVCAVVDFLIVRRVWRAVRFDTTPRVEKDGVLSRVPAAVAIGVACVAIIFAVAYRSAPKPGIFKNAPDLVASRDTSSGVLVATLPGGGQIELMAISDGVGASAPDEWWKPDGSRHMTSRFEVRNPGRITTPNLREKDFIFRFSRQDLFPPVIECNPGSRWVTGGQLWMDGTPLTGGYPLRFAWPDGIEQTTMRVGVSLVPWRSILIHDPKVRNTRQLNKIDDPRIQADFHEAGEHEGQATLTMVRSFDDGKWQSQLVAIGTNGLEYHPNRSTSSPAVKQVVWSYTFPIPLAAVKEFQVQIRPLYWVEFRDVALVGRGVPLRRTAKTPNAVTRASHDRAKGRMTLNLKPRGTVELLAIADWDAAPNAWWNPQGEAIPDALFEIMNPERPADITRQNRHMVIRMRDLPSGAGGPQVELVDAWGGSSGAKVLRDGKALSGGWLLTGSFPGDATEATLRLGFGLADYHTVYTCDASGSRQQRVDVPGIPPLETRVHQVSEAEGEAQITMLIGYPTRDWQVQVYAIDVDGKEHFTVSSRGSHAHEDQVSVWSHRFWRLPLARVKEFQARVRPVEWFEFHGIPLQPRDRTQLGRSTKPLQPSAWSEIKEVTINELFDLDKERAGVFPTAADGTKSYRGVERNASWIRTRGFDFDAATNGLNTSQVMINDLKASDWEALSVPEFDKVMNYHYGPALLPSVPAAKLPVFYGFRTAEGTMGMLQILSIDATKPAVRVRYKVIKRAHFE